MSKSNSIACVTDRLHSFEKLDKALGDFGFDSAKKTIIYKILAGILLVGDLKFVLKNSNDDSCLLSEPSMSNLTKAAKLLQLEASRLENALLSREIYVKDMNIK